jgi:hypothetical protein
VIKIPKPLLIKGIITADDRSKQTLSVKKDLFILTNDNTPSVPADNAKESFKMS